MNSLLYTADVNLQSSQGWTPLHCACRYGNVNIVQTLLSMLPNTDITDICKGTAMSTADLNGNNQLILCFFPLTSNDTVNSVVNVTKTTDVSNVVSDVTIS